MLLFFYSKLEMTTEKVVNMFEELFSSMGELKEEDRLRLASFLEKRNEYALQYVKLSEMRVKQLRNPSPMNELRASSFNDSVVLPFRTEVRDEMYELLESAVDFEALKDLLPMILAGVTRYINIPLVLSVLGTSPEDIQRLVAVIKDYIQPD
jgi:hypothetical protein